MRFHRRSAALAAAICALASTQSGVAAHADNAAPPATQLVQPMAFSPTAPPDKSETETGSTQSSGQVCGSPYITGDPDLGPKLLPQTGYISNLLRGYVPLGGLSPQHFLGRYWDYVVNNYRFPPDAGFARSGDYPNGRLLLKTTFLQAGMRIDRFGGYTGSFLAPLGDLYTRRALPPRNLNTNAQDPEHLCNYHAFRVLKSFRVDVGPVAPAFEQPGGGTQYHVLSKYIPEAPQTSEEVPISWLLQNGYLEEIEPVILTDLRTGSPITNNGTVSNQTTAISPRTTGDKAGGQQLSRTSAGKA
ncbi:TNT domain-containing protein [Nonomuraea sp. NPDC052116]|uniref:TNT domain-containing protein n=1 Tax=Nonomuraea sp. NPDC052116 TaxID=3155665 RepID=UPI0034241F19